MLEVLQRRRSRRQFSGAPLSPREIDLLYRAARCAPSAGNRRDIECFILTDQAKIAELARRTEVFWAGLTGCMDNPVLREEFERYSANFFWFGQAPALALISCKEPPNFMIEFLGPETRLTFGGESSAAMATQNLLVMAEALRLAACPLSGPLADPGLARDYLKSRHRLVALVALGHSIQNEAM